MSSHDVEEHLTDEEQKAESMATKVRSICMINVVAATLGIGLAVAGIWILFNDDARASHMLSLVVFFVQASAWFVNMVVAGLQAAELSMNNFKKPNHHQTAYKKVKVYRWIMWGVLAFHSICLVVGCFAILPSFLNGSFKSSSALFIAQVLPLGVLILSINRYGRYKLFLQGRVSGRSSALALGELPTSPRRRHSQREDTFALPTRRISQHRPAHPVPPPATPHNGHDLQHPSRSLIDQWQWDYDLLNPNRPNTRRQSLVYDPSDEEGSQHSQHGTHTGRSKEPLPTFHFGGRNFKGHSDEDQHHNNAESSARRHSTSSLSRQASLAHSYFHTASDSDSHGSQSESDAEEPLQRPRGRSRRQERW